MQKHVELSPGRMERDEADLRNIKTCIDTLLQNLWKHGHPISNFASGEIATEEIINDIIDSKNRREVARNEFIQRFKKNYSKLKYDDPIKRNQLKLFEKETRKKKHSILEDEGQSSTKFLAIFDQKKLNLRKIIDYCVTSNHGQLSTNTKGAAATTKVFSGITYKVNETPQNFRSHQIIFQAR